MLKKWKTKWSYLAHHGAFKTNPSRVLLRLASWRVLSWIGLQTTVTLRKYDIRMKLPPQWRGAAKLIYAFREMYEPELIVVQNLLQVGGTMVDVGSCFGLYALIARRAVGPGGTVLAFEPAVEAFSTLVQNVRLNGFHNVRTFRLALGDASGKIWLAHEPDPGRHHLDMQENSRDGEFVNVERLDTVYLAEGLSKLDLMKVDVEGAEELVLRGAIEVISQHHPIIILEVIPDHAHRLGLKPYGALDFLRGTGYLFYTVNRGRLEPLSNALEYGGNVIAIHASSALQFEAHSRYEGLK